jgi:two-component system cell cycle response regulator DivK
MAKILIVEDNEENWDVLSRRLKRRGFDVILAHDGAQGVATALAESPDLILMDMNMPLVDGWEATRRLRADAATRPIPVIALTAHGMDGDREKALEAGCDDHHAKPFELPRLLSQIDALLTRGGRD